MSKSSVAAASNLASTGTKIAYGEKNTVKFMVPHFPRVSTSNWADEVEEEEDEGGQSYEEVLDQE